MNYRFFHQTSKYEVVIEVELRIEPSKELLEYIDEDHQQKRCGANCKQYQNKWSCPPFSPHYAKLQEQYPWAIICLFSCDINQFTGIESASLRRRVGSTMLRSQVNRQSRALEKSLAGRLLTSHSCHLCRVCSKQEEHPCRKPKEMRYSMEATGLDLEKIAQRWFQCSSYGVRNKSQQYLHLLSTILTHETVTEGELSLLLNNLFPHWSQQEEGAKWKE